MPDFMQVSFLLLVALQLWEGGEAQTQLQQSRAYKTEFSVTLQADAAEQNTCWQQWGFPILSYSDLRARWEPQLPCQCFLIEVTQLSHQALAFPWEVLVLLFRELGKCVSRPIGLFHLLSFLEQNATPTMSCLLLFCLSSS